ncbi:hypothetical protein KAU11_08145 [Candidatus Babeliales bacterium]|nr:hypothetical protein [Candidatus Babeliales bacterium]
MALLSELDAINQILSVTGDAPVSNVNSTYEQAVVARRILLEISRQKQARGYWFNEVDEFLILKDTDGHINFPSDTIRVDIPRDNGYFVQRGLKLFNKRLNTYVFTIDIYANIVSELVWSLLPQSFRQYVVAEASLRYNAEYFGSHELTQRIEKDVFSKKIDLDKEDIDNRDLNMLKSTRASNIAFKNRR